MSKMTIKDTGTLLDDTYEAAFPPWTKREWYLVKQETDVIASDFVNSNPKHVDMNLLTAIGIVALHRAGKANLIELFWNTTDEQVVFDFTDDVDDDDEAGADPLATKPSTGDTEPKSAESTGNGGNTDGDHSDESPNPIGSLPSDISSESEPAI